MLESPLAFLRGAATVMACDLATTPTTGIQVQLSGDAHLKNFGAYATPERNLVFGVNDFDETLSGPWEWDIKALALAHASSANTAQISGYLGTSDTFDLALTAFANAYADQTERDHAALVAAVNNGRIQAQPGV
jgi:uncharacterized protein (DUF2252 family)